MKVYALILPSEGNVILCSDVHNYKSSDSESHPGFISSGVQDGFGRFWPRNTHIGSSLLWSHIRMKHGSNTFELDTPLNPISASNQLFVSNSCFFSKKEKFYIGSSFLASDCGWMFFSHCSVKKISTYSPNPTLILSIQPSVELLLLMEAGGRGRGACLGLLAQVKTPLEGFCVCFFSLSLER